MEELFLNGLPIILEANKATAESLEQTKQNQIAQVAPKDMIKVLSRLIVKNTAVRPNQGGLSGRDLS